MKGNPEIGLFIIANWDAGLCCLNIVCDSPLPYT